MIACFCSQFASRDGVAKGTGVVSEPEPSSHTVCVLSYLCRMHFRSLLFPSSTVAFVRDCFTWRDQCTLIDFTSDHANQAITLDEHKHSVLWALVFSLQASKMCVTVTFWFNHSVSSFSSDLIDIQHAVLRPKDTFSHREKPQKCI